MNQSTLTRAETCARYDITPRTLTRWMERYGLPHAKAVNGRVWFDLAALEEWEQENGLMPVEDQG